MNPLDPAVLRTLIQTTLTPLMLYSADAEELLMATAANESNLGEYRTQAPSGPARGIFQMEGEDFNDIWVNFLHWKPGLAHQISDLNNGQGTVDDLVNNDAYAIAMARVQYLRYPEAIPSASNIEAIWALYKKRYNSPQGAATHDVFMAKYKKFVLGQ